MQLEVFQILIAIAVALFGSLGTLRESGKVTRQGYVFLCIALAGGLVSAIQLLASQREREDQRFRIDPLTSIALTLEAEYYDPSVEDRVFLESVPLAFTVRSAHLKDGSFDFDFAAIPDVWRPERSRIFPPARINYIAHNFRPNYNRPREWTNLHLWDLNHERLTFYLPVNKFKPLQTGKKWRLSCTVTVLGRAFHVYPNDDGYVEVEFSDLSRQDVRRSLSEHP